MDAEKINLLRNGFEDIYKRVSDLELIFEDVLKPLKKGDVLLIEGKNGAPTYLGYVEEVHLPNEHYKGSAAIPFVLDKYGLGIPIKFQDETLRQVEYNFFKELSSENDKSPKNMCVLYSDFKPYVGIADVDERLRLAYKLTFEKFVESLKKK